MRSCVLPFFEVAAEDATFRSHFRPHRTACGFEVIDHSCRFCGLSLMDSQFRLDRIDRKILKLIQAEGRLTNHSLADRVGSSPSACLTRVRRLERSGVIQGYHARLDPFQLGIGLVLFVEITLEGRHPNEQAQFEAILETLPQIVEATAVSGDIDYVLKVVVSDMPQWTELKNDLIRGGLIRRITTHVLMRKPKIFTGYPVADV